MPKAKFRFGEVETTEGIPPIEAIVDELESNGVFGGTGEWRGVLMEGSGEEYHVGDDYLFIRFYKEVAREQSEFTDEGDVIVDENGIARVMRFLLARDGDYAFESTDGVYADDALDYLIGDDSFEIGFESNDYNRFSREQMNSFYERAFRVRGLELEEIGEHESDGSINSNIADHIERAGENAVRVDASTGQRDNDLKAPGIIDGFARLSQIKYIRMKDSEGQIQEVNRSGRYTFSYPADLDLAGQATRVRDIMSTVVDGMVHEDDG